MSINNIKSHANFHTHTNFCDGNNSPEEFVIAALTKKMRAIGFSAHVPVSISNKWNMHAEKTDAYFTEIRHLKQKYANSIEIYCGFEMDYLATDKKDDTQKYIARADYTIGSVHYLYDKVAKKYYFADGAVNDITTTINEFAHGDVKYFVTAYYQELINVINEFNPNIIGHFDIIKKQNRGNIFFNEADNWYQNLVQQVLDKVVTAGTIIEVNTGGRSRGFVTENYPSDWILQECLARKIPVIISSDAHKAENIDGFFADTCEHLKSLGFTQQKTLLRSEWVDVML